ncbi:MAG TPA: zinc-dependent metalloprotease [Blastocatellia bacterium]|nr:zinc-dependent metalloprotease [Blastocatellia bacterium]
MNRLLVVLLIAWFASPLPATAGAQERASGKSITAMTVGMQKLDGFIPLYWDSASGKMWMEISRFNAEMLYQVSLPAGIGSNPIGLDRGQLGGTYVVSFERVGPKVLMMQPNYRYRALSSDEAERRAVADSFARSVIWGFRVEAAEGERVLVDATAFLLRDAHGVTERLRMARQGSYRFDESRSTFYLPRTKGFPKNTEVETIITLAGEEPGGLIRGVTPTAQSVTVREHHSFVELPDGDYKPRAFDPRVSAMPLMFYDYASPFDTPIEKRWILRHRLQKKDPNAAVSEAVKPIVYYVDNGVPEPIRGALVEGASWWAQAFEAAGFRNAFQVKVLPPDADPMDIRYNMINWVHRSTRGWSYGASVTDPRTGEIIKGNVSLGSLRIRQDVMLGTGMIPPFTAQGDARNRMEDQCEAADSPDADYLATASAGDPATDSAAMALARIRQLSAHEVGHTLGFAHNFAASSYGRGSVMDYPAPLVEIKNGKLDLSNAYATGIGEFDKFAVKFAYSEFPAGADEKAELEKIIQKGLADGMLFIDDGDARGLNTAHPLASVWDNGSDPIATLRHEMEVRRIGLRNFGLNSIAAGQPLSSLEAKLLPLYLHHRYQLVAAAKSVGGLYFTYAVKTANGPSPSKFREIVSADRQREALRAILDTIRIEELAVPQHILDLIPPIATGFEGGTAEYFSRRTDPAFDPLAAATIAADLTFAALLDPNRAARLIDFHAQNPANPDLKEVIDAIINAAWKAPAPQGAYHKAIQQSVQSLSVKKLIDLAGDETASPLVRAEASGALRSLNAMLKAIAGADAHRRQTQEDIERFLNRPDAVRQPTRPLPTPPGDPIGGRS